MDLASFKPHLLIRGGHLQTLATVLLPPPSIAYTAAQHTVELPDGDKIVLHDDRPADWHDADPAVILIHGLCGCYGSSYMVRLAAKFSERGIRAFRMDMRGCGAGRELAIGLPHSGRSEDLLAAVNYVAQTCPESPIWPLGISMGGNIVLKMLGEIATGIIERTGWTDQVRRAAAVAPPVDPARCCSNLSRPMLRPYGWYFIRQLRRRVPPQVADREDWKSIRWDPMPKTLWDFDDLVTAPLSGFEGVEDYYHQAGSAPLLGSIDVPTMILASRDDPIIPVGCFHDAQLSSAIRFESTSHGGHVGFIQGRKSASGDRRWMDDQLLDWFTGSGP